MVGLMGFKTFPDVSAHRERAKWKRKLKGSTVRDKMNVVNATGLVHSLTTMHLSSLCKALFQWSATTVASSGSHTIRRAFASPLTPPASSSSRAWLHRTVVSLSTVSHIRYGAGYMAIPHQEDRR